MLGENIKSLRKEKGLSQEELAIKLNVVRQTVSKWEKGLSVPDSEMLIHLADALEVSVTELLGEKVNITQEDEQLKALAAKLELVNEQLARITERRRKNRRTVYVGILFIGIVMLAMQIHSGFMVRDAIGIIGGADGPTSILVSSSGVNEVFLLFTAAVLAVSIIGIYRTKR